MNARTESAKGANRTGRANGKGQAHDKAPGGPGARRRGRGTTDPEVGLGERIEPGPGPGGGNGPDGIEEQAIATRVVGYASLTGRPDTRGSTGDLRSQAKKIAAACARRGLALVEIVHELEPRRGQALARPGLGYALERISVGEADGLVVAELSRLTHSVPELGRVLEWFFHSQARLIAVVPGLDTEEPGGRIAVRTLIDLSRSERKRLVERTRNGMRAARRMGPPAVSDNPELRTRIAGMRAEGKTLQAIADELNREGVPTVRGGAIWRPSSVQAAAGYRRPRTPRTSRFPAGRLSASGGTESADAFRAARGGSTERGEASDIRLARTLRGKPKASRVDAA